MVGRAARAVVSSRIGRWVGAPGGEACHPRRPPTVRRACVDLGGGGGYKGLASGNRPARLENGVFGAASRGSRRDAGAGRAAPQFKAVVDPSETKPVAAPGRRKASF